MIFIHRTFNDLRAPVTTEHVDALAADAVFLSVIAQNSTDWHSMPLERREEALEYGAVKLDDGYVYLTSQNPKE